MSAPTQVPPPSDPVPGPVRSGRAFIIGCVVFLAVFVIFLVVGSPRLLDWTLAQAPPPAPQVIASGTLGGDAWTATAVEGDEDEVPCLTLEVGATTERFCGQAQARGAGVHVAEVRAVDDQAALFLLASPRLSSFEIATADETTTEEPSYVDFGFPVGYVAAELPATDVTVTARNSAGETGSVVTCTGVGSCTIDEGG